MSIIGWVIVGAVSGWIAGRLMRCNKQVDWLESVAIGIVGAVIGGWIWSWSTGGGVLLALTVGTLLNALVGATVLLLIWSLAAGRRTARPSR